MVDEPSLNARSVVASALLGTTPPELSVARLIAFTDLFGISENSTRVALSRMVTRGELITQDGHYRLVGALQERQNRQRASVDPPLRRWRGRWTVVIISDAARSARQRADDRTALRRARCAEMREGVWLRPDNLDIALADDHFTVLGAGPLPDAADRAAQWWPLAQWSDRAALLLKRLDRLEPATTTLGPGFVLLASVLRHLQSDPLLPTELLLDGWPGDDLRASYRDWNRRYALVLREWHRS
jgi:phenylacetic acid degradation operon negative regulatory protein